MAKSNKKLVSNLDFSKGERIAVIGQLVSKNRLEFYKLRVPKSFNWSQIQKSFSLPMDFFDGEELFKNYVCQQCSGDSIEQFNSFDDKIGNQTIKEMLKEMNIPLSKCDICSECQNEVSPKFLWIGNVNPAIPFCVHRTNNYVIYEIGLENIPELNRTQNEKTSTNTDSVVGVVFKPYQSDTKFDKDQLQRGIEVEQEHTLDKAVAKIIAKHHLQEFPDYYTRLETLETDAKKFWSGKKTKNK